MKKQNIKNISLVVTILVFMGLIFPHIFNNLKFGLDLKGGFEVLYQVKSLDGSKVTNDMVTNTYKTISNRIDSLGITEPVIIVEGNDRIRVQLAGVTNSEDARNELSSVASLTFRNTNDELLMTSDILSSGGAKIGSDDNGRPAVGLSIKNKDKFHTVTKQISESSDPRIVIWLDYEEGVNSFSKEGNYCGTNQAPRCLSVAMVEQAFSDDVIIKGNFTTEEVDKLVRLINSGSLPTKLEEVSSKTVEAAFGADSLDKTFTAGIIALVSIAIILIVLYRFAGLMASITVLIYTFLTFLTFWLFGGVLTLPGIAALVIGIGMAVDACVISFARIKDELNNGSGLQEAYVLGNKNSFMAIFDGNVTTLLTAIILFNLGESSVKGFATMLIISIIVTMFVMVYVMRILLNLFVKTKYFDNKLNLFIGYKKNQKSIFSKIDYIKYKKVFYLATIIFMVIGTVSLFTNGLKLGIDFNGGSSITIMSNQTLTKKDIESDFKTLNYDVYELEKINDNNVITKVNQTLTNEEIAKTQDYFKDKYEARTDIGVISNMVSRDLIKNAFLSLIFATIGMIIYVSFRFKFSYAISGLVALIHDALIMVMVFSLLQFEVSSIFIAALLSIIGYSINDTIVTFDRMRETITKKYKGKFKKKENIDEVVNESLKATVSRNIITSITTISTVTALIIFGSHEIFNFNIAMLIGLVAGVYSSIILAPQLWAEITKRNYNKPIKKKWYEEDDEVEEIKIKGINS
ncbi:MAG: protein translocase subunit SecD [Bacilli bacterium]|nr:protein translocase subunit SecD [Bacilli bacterium]MDD4808419.1 protein translocase subunit SecD [Bacilli bacterium]